MKTYLSFVFCFLLFTSPDSFAQDQKSFRVNFITQGVEVERTSIVKNRVSLILDNQSHVSHILKLLKNKVPIQYINLRTRQTQTIDIKLSKKDKLELMPLSPASSVISLN